METRICPECGAVNTCDRDICFKCEELLIEKPIESERKTGSIAGTIVSVIVCIFIVMVFMALAIPSTGGSRKSARQKACIANMKMLENALEMYDMDTPPGEGSSHTTVVCRYGAREPVADYADTLQTGGYVQRMPMCPTTGNFEAYSVLRDSAKEYEIRVECSVHGTIYHPKGA